MTVINFRATWCTPCVAELPQTIVLGRNGTIVYNKVGSVTYELLESLVAPLMEQ